MAGRLRLAHEANEALSIETEIIRYDEKVAVVVAVSKTSKGSFKGIGMASIERDQKTCPRHPGIGGDQSHRDGLFVLPDMGLNIVLLKKCPSQKTVMAMVETVITLGVIQMTICHARGNRNGDNLPAKGNRNGGSGSNNPGNGGNGGSNGNGNNRPSGSDGNGNGNGRLSAKQYQYLQKLNAEDLGRASADLDKQCLAMFGTVAQYLVQRVMLHGMIEHLLAQ